MKAAYMTKGALDVLDKMNKARYGKIIDGLYTAMNRSDVSYKDKILIGKNDMTISVLKQVLGDLQSTESYESFINSFRSWSGHLPPETDKEKNMGTQKRLVEDMWDTPLIKFTDDFWLMLDKIADEVCWGLYELDTNVNIKNGLGIEKVDVSDKYNYFDVVTKGKPGKISVNQFLKYFFGKKYSDKEVGSFVKSYNRLVSQYANKPAENRISLPEFKYSPKDVRATFLSLVTETYPYGTEEEVMKYMPQDLTKDEYGNYYKIIGDSDTMFTSHLDTASRTKDEVGLVSYTKDNDEFICTDGTSILGADDKSGVAVMLYMMAHEVPGVYFFFYGEERGGIGSGKVAVNHEKYPFLSKMKKCISFDRRNYYSIITAQMSVECCSDEFATSLCDELNKSGLKLNLDPTGVFTDSANFTDIIGECTNVSVGYFNEHTHDEVQNITYLEKLAKACVAADWSKLTIKRRVGFDDELMGKYSKFVTEFKKSVFYNYDKIKGHNGSIIITMEIDDYGFNHFEKDMAVLDLIFRKHNIDPDVTFDGDKIKFEIR